MGGLFVTVEGIEGVGKSTNIEFVADILRRAGRAVTVTREPGGTPVAEAIRTLLLDTPGGAMPPLTELLLMFAARAAHLDEVVRPALAEGRAVVCDRFTDATYAYQGGGRGIDPEPIRRLEQLVQRGLGPDLTLLLDAPYEATVGRRDGRGVDDRFEREAGPFFRRVREAYLARASAEPARIHVIDASRPLPEVQRDIALLIEKKLHNSTTNN